MIIFGRLPFYVQIYAITCSILFLNLLKFLIR